jgi:hypothetical protein
MGHGAAGGAAIGGVRAGMDQDLAEVPGGMIRGAIGGAIGAPIGRAVGNAAGRSDFGKKYLPFQEARSLGSMLGGATGGFLASGAKQTNYEKLRHPFSYDTMATDPYGGMVVTGSDHNANLIKLFKHASSAGHEHTQILPAFLKAASNNVKKGFAKVLTDNPKLLKIAGDLYGEETLLDALQPRAVKTAAVGMTGGALWHADKDTKPSEYFQAFGEAAPEAFNGVLLKGYHFKDTRPSLNLAVQTQELHRFSDARESGVYQIYAINKKPEAALVIVEPVDIFREDRATFPKDEESRVKRVITKTTITYEVGRPEKDVERSHKLNRLVILGDGRYYVTQNLMGEQVIELALKGSKVFKNVMSDSTSTPRAGKGVFIYKRGVHYFSTKPLELSDITTDSNKVVRAKASHEGGWGAKKIVIDPKSPMGRISRPRDTDLVLIPGRWKWLPLGERANASDYLSQPSELTNIMVDALGSMGVHKLVARRAGQSMYAVNGQQTTDKVSALRKLAEDGRIHISAAEAMLKIAEVQNICQAYVVSPSQYKYLLQKVADVMPPAPPGMAMPPAPPAPPAPAAPPGAPPPMDPNAPPPAMAEAPPAPSGIDQAFQETTQELQKQIDELQAQLTVLTTVQERANQINGGGQEPMPQDPALAAPPEGGAPMPTPPPMPPAMGGGQAPMPAAPPSQQDPMAAQQGAPPMDPNAQQAQGGPPPMPVMHTEEPSAEEIAQQINPNFLAQAGQFHDQGAFDAGAVGSLAQTPSLQNISTQYAANLEDSVDDLGRTLLTLYMQESELKEQLGDDAFVKLETQLRDTFKNLGALTLNLSHNTAQLNNHDVSQGS